MIKLELLKYGLVGVSTNAAMFVAYLLLTELELGHKLAMTVMYAFGVSLTFFVHRNWSFTHRGRVGASSVRYVICYFSGYILNLLLLYLFVDRMGLPHERVQLVLVLVVAGYLFLVMKFWVFRAVISPETIPTCGFSP